MVYDKQATRPAYSFNKVLGYQEISVLVVFATTQETATQLCIILSDPA